MRKRVYILGAGFSVKSGLPLQNGILPRILNFSYLDDFPQDPQLVETWSEDYKKILKYFKDVLRASPNPSLEDLFTLLDQAIEAESNIRSYNWKELIDVRDALKRLILIVFYPQILAEKASYNYIASKIIRRRISAGQQKDAVSVITLNWDTLLEDSFFNSINRLNLNNKIDVDYCCRTNPLPGSDSPHTCSLTQKSRGVYNLKVLKLHGSMNWLMCPACNILYTGLGSTKKQVELYLKDHTCPNCSKTKQTVNLNHFFVTPTFLKAFTNPHIKMTWYNAFIELSEADEIVFLGYSFPQADYHFRALIRSAIRPGVQVKVVLAPTDNPKRIPQKVRAYLPTQRYSDFFGSRKVSFDYGGIENHFGLKSDVNMKFRRNLLRIKRILKRSQGRGYGKTKGI